MTNKTTAVTVTATDGTPITLVAPTDLPSNERADQLVALYKKHVRTVSPSDSWKAECYAAVPCALAREVTEAMNHMGSIVDSKTEIHGRITVLYSRGYWAHGF